MRPLGLPAVCACLLAAPLAAADGDLDPTFSADGMATVLWDEPGTTQAEASGVAALPDGSLVVGGTLGWIPSPDPLTFDWVLAKITRTGILDTSWGESGRKRIAFDLVEGGGDLFLGVFPDPDGSVFAVGSTYDGATLVPAIVRLLPNGDGDPAFGDAGFLYLDTPWADPQMRFVAARAPARRQAPARRALPALPLEHVALQPVRAPAPRERLAGYELVVRRLGGRERRRHHQRPADRVRAGQSGKGRDRVRCR